MELEDGNIIKGLLCPPTYPGYMGGNWHIAVKADNENRHGGELWAYKEIGFESIRRYTGIKIEGKRLYEGDIIRYCECYIPEFDGDEDINEWKTSEIIWCSELSYPAFDLKEHDFDTNGINALIVKGYTIEIIGNAIHERALMGEYLR